MEDINNVTGKIVDASYCVHSLLGPGLLERAYHKCLERELSKRHLKFESEISIPIYYEDIDIECGFRADLLVDERVLVEIKACERLTGLHKAQLTTYLKLTGIQVGLLINFNCETFKNNVVRLVHNYKGFRPSENC